ncbi:glutamine--tRNA ligase/YqeY domain fusion protein [Vreelandella utahensis]|uniref:glutamine--tRNA ligase/YqeY domain fusion protein n=1 Tax=Vreelandella halophila TaxID=86177 RepID=UPI00098467EA|nr:glutamine--tRNA ligase/YqeY domain fusion protein [Halomonas utahensis]
MSSESAPASNFIRTLIQDDLAEGRHDHVVTRFPPEPNGYLHIGHAKSIVVNFGMAEQFGGDCTLRFDDTNPEKESQEYIEAIKRDVTWLGYEWKGPVRYASDYFDRLYEYAEELIRGGHAYVCSLDPETAAQYRGTLKEAGTDSPYRDRSVEENLDLFRRMRAGEFAEGEHVLRAKIDMASPNMNMRDPILYRIRYLTHHQTGDKWCIYPMYDFTHPLSDAEEGVTHSLCTLEFEDHRPLYDWVLEHVTPPCRPRQTEFARLNVNYTITSKRKLMRLVDEGHVDAWNDPRMPTLSGMRRRGFTPASLRQFCDMVGVNKTGGTVDLGMLEHAIRDDLNRNAPRAMCVLRPVKLVLTNYPEGQSEILSTAVHPQDESMGTREVTWTREMYIDAEDFVEVPPNKKWKRLSKGNAVRLRGGYVITCNDFVTDDDGNVTEIHAEYDPATLGVNPEGYKPKGVIHWVSAETAVDLELRLYDRLFGVENPGADKNRDFVEDLNPDNLVVMTGCKGEANLASPRTDIPYQFEREGYFFYDPEASSENRIVMNRTVTLRDSWAKISGQ